MNNQEIIRPEPYGHFVSESKLERYWAQNAGLMSLQRRRVTKFDPHASITYVPMEYVSRPIQLRVDLPQDCWITESLTEFVRTEYPERKSPGQAPTFQPIEAEEIETPETFLDNLLQNSSDEISGILKLFNDRSRSKDTSPEGMAQTIYELLSHPLVGTKRNRDNVIEKDFVAQVATSIKNHERLLFVLPGFPFKDQNRFRVPYDADQPDMGELAFMIRLYRLTQVLYQVHPFGADVLVLTDGELYHRIFGVALNKVRAYAEKLKAYRGRLNLHGTVSFISLDDLIQRASVTSPSPNARDVAKYIRERVEELTVATPQVTTSFEVLVSAMKWNYDSRSQLGHLSQEEAWEVLHQPRDSIAEHLLKEWDQLHNYAVDSAYEYVSVNLMLRWMNLIREFFPDAIRGTIHPKPGQIALVQAGGSLPWNGVPWSEEWPRTIDDFEVKPFFSLASHLKLRKVIIRTYGNPCFYTKAALGRNIIAAKDVFPLTGWEFEGVFGRAFLPSDSDALVSLGKGDKTFSWERLPMGANYYHRILKFRIEHYEAHGFGVHGIWLGTQLIGQCGLQVLNEAQDQVEFVVFLGNKFVRQGLGLKLMQYAIRSCSKAGMRSIYGVARTENHGALALLRKVGAKPIRSQVHFGYLATIFEIPLKP